ncbi:MAG TPA: maleylpyruvate isomerase N-terminal domain-containing protein [Mycobacterium sp.]
MTLVETTRDELRERIAEAHGRFERLARGADPSARQRGSRWTVHQLAAHVLTVAHRYQSFARSGDYRRAAYPREVDVINQAELEAVMAPVPDLVAQLRDVTPEVDALFDEIVDVGPVIPFHSGAMVDGVTAQTNWLAELLLHGEDIARAIRVPWVLPERDMLLVARGMMPDCSHIRARRRPG